jgi:hypothetical protein
MDPRDERRDDSRRAPDYGFLLGHRATPEGFRRNRQRVLEFHAE